MKATLISLPTPYDVNIGQSLLMPFIHIIMGLGANKTSKKSGGKSGCQKWRCSDGDIELQFTITGKVGEAPREVDGRWWQVT